MPEVHEDALSLRLANEDKAVALWIKNNSPLLTAWIIIRSGAANSGQTPPHAGAPHLRLITQQYETHTMVNRILSSTGAWRARESQRQIHGSAQ